MDEIKNAKLIMLENNYKLVVVKDGLVKFSSSARGIKPIYDIYSKSPELLMGAYISDRVTGKAAAMILSKAGIAGIYTDLISEQAIQIFKDHKIDLMYEKKVDSILNRDKTGSCPIESISKDLKADEITELILGIENFLSSIN